MTKDLCIDNIKVGVGSNGSYTITVSWSCPTEGYGELTFGHNENCVGPFDFMDDEWMSKEFIMEIFEKMYERFKGDDKE